MYDWIRRNGYDPIIIATKLDKINRSQIQKQVRLIRTTLQAGADTQIVPYSAQTKQEGKKSTRSWTECWQQKILHRNRQQEG